MAFAEVHQSEQWIIENCVYAVEKARDLGVVDGDITPLTTVAGLVALCKGKLTHPADDPQKLDFDIFTLAKARGVLADADVAAATGVTNLSNSFADLHESGTAFRLRQAPAQIHP